MSEWKEYKLGDIAEITSSKRIFYSEYVENGVPFYRSKEIIDLFNRRDIQTELFITEKRFNEIEVKFGVPMEDDILLTSVGSLGVPYKVKPKDKFYFKDGNLTWFRNLDKSKVIPDFLFTWISSNVGKQKLDEVSIGSTQAALTISGLKTIEILLPDIKTQKSIATILSSLDDKIDLLHRQNITLEKMAETLFRQWFVEEAKEDWEEISLYDAIELVGGGTPKTTVNEYWDGNIKWLSGGDIAGNHKNFVVSSEKSITELGLKNSSAKLLPKFSTVISARGTVGKYCMLSEPMTFSQSNYGILPKFKNCFFFTYLLVAHSVDELQSAAYGSVFDTITTNTFKGLTITLPEEEYIIRFNESMEPYFSKILTNQTQIRTLSALRNTLLPKLMSGVVTIEC
ncbi:MAG: restriction endonuclease subunit S [Dysgonamonadaceae bacterium]|jgi:type I restriction enzyme S subunit|nr:restriction endonuclease subunit S [Dysgonamonadaceae bacterium]